MTMRNKINIASNFSMPAIDYAAQGNSIIGIRNSGKTYSATKVAEELMKAGIPIIAFDPTGVWQNLRNGIDGNKGFPVVVAGGMHADLPLSEQNATKIVEAALKEGISLVIDLKGTATSTKNKWIHIVSECVEFLMGHNDQYGLRHVFIEEAAEFVPQAPSPGGKVVYSRIESLARMGRNFGLGYTLINQRAEEIAKAVFEISEMVLVHRQAGKNSLNSIKRWLEIRNDDQETEIIKSLPKLGNGECWAINEVESLKIQVLPKETFHPDPKKGKTSLPQNTKVADRSIFIQRLNTQLGDIEVELKTVTELQAVNKKLKIELTKKSVSTASDVVQSDAYEKLTLENSSLRKELIHQQARVKNLVDYIKKYQALLKGIQTKIEKETPLLVIDANETSPAALLAQMPENVPVISMDSERWPRVSIEELDVPTFQSDNLPKGKMAFAPKTAGKLGKCSHAIALFLATYPDRFWSKTQIGIATDYSPTSSGFQNSLSELNTKGIIVRENSMIRLNPDINIVEWIGWIEKKKYDIQTFKNKLGKCEAEIYQVLLDRPQASLTKEGLASLTPSKYSPTSSGYQNALSKLNTLELIRRTNGMIRLNPELLEI
jgi:hypothetical protein